jgi:putative membrane protein
LSDERASGGGEGARFGDLGLFLRGVCMGAADVVPGVSGGTMAFILGIYETLVESIRRVGRPPFWQALLGGRFAEALALINFRFLVALGAGILTAVLSLARLLSWLLRHHPVLLWSFFFGLILASVVVVSRRIERWSPPLVAALVAGTLGAFWLVGQVPAETPTAPWFLFLSGALAITAMSLPGISGSFIRVLLGKYQYLLDAVNCRDIPTLLWFVAGIGIGIVSFAQLLGWLFKRHHDLTVALLTGFMLGSLRKVWPWKLDLLTRVDRHGEVVPVVQANVLNAAFGGGELAALGLALLGLAAVFALEAGARRGSR